MPNVGERRTVGGVTGEWDGEAWVRVAPEPPEPSSQGGEFVPAAIRAASSFGGPLVSAGGETVAQLAEMATGRRTPSIYPSEAFGLSPVQIGVAGVTGMIPGVRSVRGLRMATRGAVQGGAEAALQEAASAYGRGESPRQIATQSAKAGGMGAAVGAITPGVMDVVTSTASKIPHLAAELAPGLTGRIIRLFRRLPTEAVEAPTIPNGRLSYGTQTDAVQNARNRAAELTAKIRTGIVTPDELRELDWLTTNLTRLNEEISLLRSVGGRQPRVGE